MRPCGRLPIAACLGSILADHGDDLADQHDRAGLGLDVQDTRVLCLDLHVALVRLDLGDHVPRRHRLTVLLHPLNQGAFFHRVTHLGHDHFWHGLFPKRSGPASS